jgi:CheY-like chemotaxis protein
METVGRGAGVLIADDRADIRALLAARLGLDPALQVVGEATNGAEAIAKVAELQPAALVLDLQMPVMSGEEAIPILRSVAPELRIVVFSAFVGVQQNLCGCECPDAEIAKGGDLKMLVGELRRLLDCPPEDVLEVDLGLLNLSPAAQAVASWRRLSIDIRATTPTGQATADLLALMGVFLSVGEQVRCAAAEGLEVRQLRFATRRPAAVSARRALDALHSDVATALDPLRGPLLAGLPV